MGSYTECWKNQPFSFLHENAVWPDKPFGSKIVSRQFCGSNFVTALITGSFWTLFQHPANLADALDSFSKKICYNLFHHAGYASI